MLLGAGSAASAGPTITVDATGDSLANGQALVDAVAEAGTLNPSVASQVTIMLAEGTYEFDDATALTLPDGVNIVGAGSGLTTLCRECDLSIYEMTYRGDWFISPGMNRFGSLRMWGSGTTIINSSAGDITLDNVVADGPRHAVEAAAGSVVVLSSSLSSEISATGTTSVTFIDSNTSGRGTSVDIENGRLDIADSTLTKNSPDGAGPVVWANGAADINITNSTIQGVGGDQGGNVIWLRAGGSLDVVGSTVSASSKCCGSVVRSIAAVDAAVNITDSTLVGEILMTGGAVHLASTDVELGPNNITLVTLNDAVGSMSGGDVIHNGYGIAEFLDTIDLVKVSGTYAFVFDGVSIQNGRVRNSADIVCIATTNTNIIAPLNQPIDVVAIETPPSDCVEGVAQVAYPGGAHAVPGSIEVEDYDASATAGVSWSDSDDGNFRGDHRADGVDIWSTVGEDGHTVGRTRGGEWLEYTFDVANGGEHEFAVRLATGYSAPGGLRLSVDGATVGTIEEAPADGWWNFSTVPVGVADLTAGAHVLRLDITGNGQINLDRIDVSAATPPVGCAGLGQEGEAGVISGSMEASASSVGSVAGTRNKYSGVDGADFVEFCVAAPAAGTYELDTIVKAPNSTSDSFYVEVNAADPVTWHIGPIAAAFEPRTVKVGATPVQFELVEGDNVVRFHHRETGTELDSFAFRSLETVCDGSLSQGHQAGSASGTMVVSSDRAESAPGTSNKYVFNDADYVEYCVSVPVAGTYTLQATVVAPTTRSDSFYITVGDADPVTWHIPNADEFTERTVATGAQNPQQFVLEAGPNKVRFYHRETGTGLASFTFVAAS